MSYASWSGTQGTGANMQILDVSGADLSACSLSLTPGNRVVLPPLPANIQVQQLVALTANVSQILTVGSNMNVAGAVVIGAGLTTALLNAAQSNVADVMTAVHWYTANFNGTKGASFAFYKSGTTATQCTTLMPLSGDSYSGPLGYTLPPQTQLILFRNGVLSAQLNNGSAQPMYVGEGTFGWNDPSVSYILRRIGQA